MSEPKKIKISTGHSQLEEQTALHPLLIDLVLDKIFQHILVSSGYSVLSPDPSTTNDFCNFRLVCKTWKERSTLAFRPVAPWIKFGDDRCQNPCYCTNATAQKFMSVIKSSTLMPFERFSFTNGILAAGHRNLFHAILEITAFGTSELRFFFNENTELTFMRETVTICNFPKLDKLSIFFGIINSSLFYKEEAEITNFVKLILEASLKLSEFSVSKWLVKPQDAGEKCIQEILRRLPSTITKLGLSMLNLTDFHFRALSEANLKLTECEIDCSTGPIDNATDDVRIFFESQSQSLTHLSLDVRNWNEISSEFPPLTHLKQLTVGTTVVPPVSTSQLFPNLNFLNLEKLNKEVNFSNFIQYAQKIVSVEEIFLPYSFPLAGSIARISKCFPNIKKLHVSPFYLDENDKSLEEVFTHFVEIEELYVCFKTWHLNGDSILSGISKRQCRRLAREKNFIDADLRELQEKPSILNLTKIRKLELDSEHPGIDGAKITDLSVHFVFLKMANLQELRISGCISKITRKCQELLRKSLKTFELVDLDDEYSANEEESLESIQSSDSAS